MPEALTKWKFIGFAHDKDLRSGFLNGEVVTAKDLMVQPNPPRFLREGDVLEFTVEGEQPVARRGRRARCGSRFADARTRQAARRRARRTPARSRRSTSPAGESKTFAWRLTVPDGVGPITYKAVGGDATGSPTARRACIPVLSKRVLVTESLPLPIRGAGRRRRSTSRSSASPATVGHAQAPDAARCRWCRSRRGTR